MAQSGPAPVIATDSLQVDPARALTNPKNAAEQASAGMQNPAFAYAWDQNKGKIPGTWEGDNATIDAIFAIAQKYATPPTSPTLTSLAPNTAVRGAAQFVMTLTGTNFQPGLIVVFGTVVETRVTVVSATSATVTVYPSWIPSAGTILVKVRNGGGAADSATVNFTVT
jgi:IPT/TIG domain-containing protein